MNKDLKIYFAGSIRGGRSDATFYLTIVEHLQQYGTVLTEHVADLDLSEQGEDGPSDEWIFQRDLDWLKQSDILVAEVTTPSLGVGYELGLAESMNKKILCLYRQQKGKKLSAMIAGNSKFNAKTYQLPEEALPIIDEFFKDLS